MLKETSLIIKRVSVSRRSLYLKMVIYHLFSGLSIILMKKGATQFSLFLDQIEHRLWRIK